MAYKDKLQATKKLYPFDNWRALFYPDPEEDFEGITLYSPENCNRAQQILDTLIKDLLDLGEKAPEADKLRFFEVAVLSFNKLEEDVKGIIESGEQEDLCETFDAIAKASGIDPEDYGDSIADEWRKW